MGLESTPQESAPLLKMLMSLSCKKLTPIFSFMENFRNAVGHLMPRQPWLFSVALTLVGLWLICRVPLSVRLEFGVWVFLGGVCVSLSLQVGLVIGHYFFS